MGFKIISEDLRKDLENILPKKAVDIIIEKYNGRAIYDFNFVSLKPGDILDFSCQKCGKCCKSTPTPLYTEDIINLHKHNPSLNFYETFRGIFIENVEGASGPYLTFQKKEDDHCIFYDESKGCGIHDYKPLLCKLFPIKTSSEELDDNKKIIFNVFLHASKCKGLFEKSEKIDVQEAINSNIERIKGKIELMADLEGILKERKIDDISNISEEEIIEILESLYSKAKINF